MTKMLETAIAKMRELDQDEQDRVARFLLHLADTAGGDVYVLTPDERAAIEEASEQADCGEFATDEELAALWKKCGH